MGLCGVHATFTYYITHCDSLQLWNYQHRSKVFHSISFNLYLQNSTPYAFLKRTHKKTHSIVYTMFKHLKYNTEKLTLQYIQYPKNLKYDP